MLEAQLGRVQAADDPAFFPGLVTVDPVPHDLADEAADILEAGGAIELRHADRHFVAAALRDPFPCRRAK